MKLYEQHHRRRTAASHADARSSRRGSALVLALIVVSMVAALGAGYLRITTAVVRRQTAEVESVHAFYLAEAGLAEAFQAVRVGRSGQLGSEEAPAVYGDGLLWVDATDAPDGQVRLVSTGLCGSGRATLSYVIEPIEIPLGFFSDEDLVVESVLLVDGFDSEEATYEEEVEAGTDLQEYALWLAGIVGREIVEKYVGNGTPEVAHELAYQAELGPEQEAELVSLFPDLHEAHLAGTLFPATSTTTDPVEPTTESNTVIFGTGGNIQPVDSDAAYLDSTMDSSSADPSTSEGTTATTTDETTSTGWGDTTTSSSEPTPTLPEEHTTAGGLLGSNGSVVFTLPGGEPVEIYGDVVPGPDGTVEGLGDVSVSGDTEPRTAAVDLPEVEVPVTAMAPAVRHDGILPMLISAGTSGHARIEVAPDAELVLRGPATVVIGELVLEPGALLTLDTRDGDVELYVTGGMDFEPGSVVTTSSDLPEELSIQVAAIPSGVDGAPVQLEATSQFHGTVYAPETEVRVGGDFEVYGGIVARKLELGAGAKLHFDNAEYEGLGIPRIVSWKIVEVPAAVRGRLGDPFEVLGVERGTLAPLSDAHDLASVTLTIEYLDHGGTPRSYSGTEDAFDWELVAEVVKVERDATREKEEGASGEEPAADPEPAVRTSVTDYLDGYPSTMNSKDLVDLLIPLCPLSADEWALIDASGLGAGQHGRLQDEDLAAVGGQ